MHKKCMKSCLKLGFVDFYCMGFVRLLKKVWWTKDEEKVATIKTNYLGTVETYLLSTCSVSSCCHQQGLQLQFPWTAVVADGSEGSGFLPSLFQHQYCCSGFFHQCWRLVGDAADHVTGLLCFLHPFAKTEWALISPNLRKMCTFHLLNLAKMFEWGTKTSFKKDITH